MSEVPIIRLVRPCRQCGGERYVPSPWSASEIVKCDMELAVKVFGDRLDAEVAKGPRFQVCSTCRGSGGRVQIDRGGRDGRSTGPR